MTQECRMAALDFGKSRSVMVKAYRNKSMVFVVMMDFGKSRPMMVAVARNSNSSQVPTVVHIPCVQVVASMCRTRLMVVAVVMSVSHTRLMGLTDCSKRRLEMGEEGSDTSS